MSAHPTHDLAIKTGEYQDHQGQTKGRWLRVGAVFRHDDGGTSIKLDAIPLGIPDWQGWISVFPRTQQQAPGRAQPPAQGREANGYANARQAQAPIPPPAPGGYQDFDDEIPFD